MTRTVSNTTSDSADREREHFVARAIKSRVRRRQPLNADALAEEAIWLCERGTSYSEFIRQRDPDRWRCGIFKPYRVEVERQLALQALSRV